MADICEAYDHECGCTPNVIARRRAEAIDAARLAAGGAAVSAFRAES